MAARERRYERERGLTLLPRNKQGIWKLHEERMDGTAGAEFVAMEEEGGDTASDQEAAAGAAANMVSEGGGDFSATGESPPPSEDW